MDHQRGNPVSADRLDHILDEVRTLYAATEGRCLNCKASAPYHHLYRCWDCKTFYCENCVKGHFGQQHQPHPYTYNQICNLLIDLYDALEKAAGEAPEQFEEALFWRTDGMLRALRTGVREVPQHRKHIGHQDVNDENLNDVLERGVARIKWLLEKKKRLGHT